MGKNSSAETIKAISGALITALILKLFVVDFMIAEGNSMEPAINPGRILVVFKLNYGLRFPGSGLYILRWALPKENDIVVFFTPQGDIAVKRCSSIYPDGNFYALGDNSRQSYDSLSYGPIPIDNVVGRVIGIR